jgi:hypothetical protein
MARHLATGTIMRRTLLVLTIALLSSPALAAGTLTPTGLGKVEIGMTVAQAEAALGTKLRVDRLEDEPGACGYARRADGEDPGISYMVDGDVINRIDVDGNDPAVPPPDVTTEKGIGIGATEDQIRHAYGKAAIESPHPYTAGPDSHYFKVTKGENALLFETYNGKVNTFRAGLSEAIDYIEGCL